MVLGTTGEFGHVSIRVEIAADSAVQSKMLKIEMYIMQRFALVVNNVFVFCSTVSLCCVALLVLGSISPV